MLYKAAPILTSGAALNSFLGIAVPYPFHHVTRPGEYFKLQCFVVIIGFRPTLRTDIITLQRQSTQVVPEGGYSLLGTFTTRSFSVKPHSFAARTFARPRTDQMERYQQYRKSTYIIYDGAELFLGKDLAISQECTALGYQRGLQGSENYTDDHGSTLREET